MSEFTVVYNLIREIEVITDVATRNDRLTFKSYPTHVVMYPSVRSVVSHRPSIREVVAMQHAGFEVFELVLLLGQLGDHPREAELIHRPRQNPTGHERRPSP